MNKEQGPRQVYRSQLTRQLLLQYLGALVLWPLGVVVFTYASWRICAQFTWYPDDLLYRILDWVQSNIVVWVGVLVLAGWVVLSYRFLSKPLRYLDELVAASERMVLSPQEPVRLPPAVKNLQDELNLVRERSLRSALEAREAVQRKNDLIVYLAHDLKTPLTSVIGYLSLLQEAPDLPAAQRARYTGIALDKAQRLEDLINEFFEITRFNLSQLTLEVQTVDLTRMLEQVCSEFAPALAEKDLHTKLSLPPELPCPCDPGKLARVFDNLLRNAAGYARPGSDVEIGGRLEGEAAVLTFRNYGRTIPPEKLARIFEQFFRLDSARATSGGGAGLGLAIARQIVERHGGAIRAESADEQVTFTVTLPVGKS